MQSNVRFRAFTLLLERITSRNEINIQLRHDKKLTNLYGRPVPRKEKIQNVINLSNEEVSQDIRTILDLGLNCHLKQKFDENV